MRYPYAKLHGAGNSYVFVDARERSDEPPWPAVARAIADPATGLGGDGLIVIGSHPMAACSMRIFNRDGGEAEFCGNGIRALGKYLYDRGQVGRSFVVATGLGKVPVEVVETDRDGAAVLRVGVRPPRVRDTERPYLLTAAGARLPVVRVSVGNPHAVLIRQRMPTLAWLRRVGPAVSRHPAFPAGVNFHAAAVRSPERVRVWHYERGSGETRACGSGAIAVFAAGRQLGLLRPRVEIETPGGRLVVEEGAPAGTEGPCGSEPMLYLTGPAREVSRGWVSAGRGR